MSVPASALLQTSGYLVADARGRLVGRVECPMYGTEPDLPDALAVRRGFFARRRRLVPGYEAPVYVAWSRRNRSALIRIPLYKPGSEQATRAEIRCPDPACNPYLTFATLLHAGLEGIENGYELPEPMETNLYHLTPEQRRERGIVSLPETLGEAIDALAHSELAKKALGPHIFDRYVELKRKEWDEYRVQLTDWERDRYLAVL